MNDNVVRLSVVGQIIGRRWRLLVALAAVGALLGAGASFLGSPGYQSQSKVLLQGPRDQQEVLTETQIAMSIVVLDRTAASLGWGDTGAELRDSVTAAVADGSLIQITGTANTPEQARQLTDAATVEYVNFSTQIVNDAAAATAQVVQKHRDSVQQRIDDTNKRITELQGSPALASPGGDGVQARAELEQRRTSLTDATKELDAIDGRSQDADAKTATSRASIKVIEPALLPSGAAEPTMVQLVGAGAVSFFLLGVFAHLAALRADRRLRTVTDIAAALGAPVLGSVDLSAAPEGPPTAAATHRRGERSWLVRLLRDDIHWDPSQAPFCADEAHQAVRYRRVLTRLRGTPDLDLRLLVLVADDDPTAFWAAAQLAVAAAGGGRPASVVTDSAEVARMVQTAACAAPDRGRLGLTVRTSAAPAPGTDRTVLRIVEVSAARPTVPECGPLAGALVLLAVGSRIGWELMGISEACSDAGYNVLGALVVVPGPRPTTTERPGKADHADGPVASQNGKAMAGSA